MDESGRFPLNVYKTESVKLQLSYKEFTGLAEIDHTGKLTGEKGGFTCSNINFDECVNQKKANLMLDKTTDNCTVPFIFDNEKICTQPNDIRIAYKISRRKYEGQRTTNIDCDIPCKTLFTSFGGKAKNVIKPPSDQQIAQGNGNVKIEVNKADTKYNTKFLQRRAKGIKMNEDKWILQTPRPHYNLIVNLTL